MKNWLKKRNDWLVQKLSTHNWKFKLFSSAFPGVGTVLLIFLKDPVFKSTALAWQYWSNSLPPGTDRTNYKVAWLVLLYYFLILCWLVSYYIFVQLESFNNKKSIAENKSNLEAIKAELNAAIHYAPNAGVFLEYKPVLEQIFDDLQILERESAALSQYPSSMLAVYDAVLPSILKRICELTKSFARHKSNNYSANIMVYVENSAQNKVVVQKLLANKDMCIFFQGIDFNEIVGVLHCIPSLMTYIGNDRNIPPITLPIIKINNNGTEIILPGAPMAALKGETVVDKIDLEAGGIFSSLPDSVREEAKGFFLTKGHGIESIVSLSIPELNNSRSQLVEQNKSPFIGVVNVDCDRPYLLGNEEKYYTTYHSLIKPIIYLLAPHVKNYYNMYNWPG